MSTTSRARALPLSLAAVTLALGISAAVTPAGPVAATRHRPSVQASFGWDVTGGGAHHPTLPLL